MRRPAPSRAALWLLAFALAAPARAGTIGLVPDPDPDRQQQLLRGAQLALADGDGGPRLAVGRPAGHWNGLTAVIEELIEDEGAEVLIAPVERRAAHLVAQIATRRHLPAIAASAAGQLAATGSWWLVTCRRDDGDARRLAARLGRPPSQWEVAGWAAARAAGRLFESPGETWSHPGSTWRDRLPAACRDRAAGAGDDPEAAPAPEPQDASSKGDPR